MTFYSLFRIPRDMNTDVFMIEGVPYRVWLRHYEKIRKVAGSRPVRSVNFFEFT
jgi:hypothetical protein